MKEEKLKLLKEEIVKIGNKVAVYLNEDKKEIQLRMMEDEEHSLRGFLIRKEGDKVNVGELLQHMVGKILTTIFTFDDQGSIVKVNFGRISHDKFGNYVVVKDSKKYVDFKFYGKRAWRAFKTRTPEDTFKLTNKSIKQAQEHCIEILESVFMTTRDDFTSIKDVIAASVEYINVL